jgi:flotillin
MYRDQTQVEEKKKSSVGAIVSGLVMVAGVGVVGLAFASTRWIRCPPNKVRKWCFSRNVQLMIIYGTGNKPKFVHGGGSYVWPLYQQYRFIDLAPVQIPIDLVC